MRYKQTSSKRRRSGKMRNSSTPHSNKKKGRNRTNKSLDAQLANAGSSPVQEANVNYSANYSMVYFPGQSKPLKISFDESLPVMSLEEYEEKYKPDLVPDITATPTSHRTNKGKGRSKSSTSKAGNNKSCTEAEISKFNESEASTSKTGGNLKKNEECGQINVAQDRTLINNLPEPKFKEILGYEEQIGEAEPLPNSYIRFMERSSEELDGEVEYDLDEEDTAWLSIINERRKASGLPILEADTFELLMDRLEKESYFQQQNSGGCTIAAPDEDAVCCICLDGECQNSNAILFCDMCNLAVHQDCYGVPYIPEGQWLCRRCLQSPSRAVDCALCPNRGGAFKQTDKPSTWAHVVCALWIPEVRFANTVFLEPIDSIESIPAARWKLTCCICKKKGVGACIQCHKSSCYQAFHVTCAQQAGLCMRMRTVTPANGEATIVQKTAFCEAHAPPDYQPSTNPADARRRAIANKKSTSAPVISIPTIPTEKIKEIANLAEGLPKKNQLIERLIAYWTLKRQFRNGVPLIRRLQSSHLNQRPPPSSTGASSPKADSEDKDELFKQLKYWQCLRQDLERARLLCELVRKREKLKRELIKVKEKCLWYELKPLESTLKIVLETLKTKDPNDIFGEPVDTEEVSDYLDIVTQPMDLSTMAKKVDDQEYESFSDFEDDFNLMISNCLAYNRKDTVFYRAGIKMREQGGAVIQKARQDYDNLDLSLLRLERETVNNFEEANELKADAEESLNNVEEMNEDMTNNEESSFNGLIGSSINISNNGVANCSNESDSAINNSNSGVNRRTAVLFTRKAKGRVKNGTQIRPASPDNNSCEQNKESDSFRVYRSGGTDSDIGDRDSQSSSCSSCSTSRSSTPDREDGDIPMSDLAMSEIALKAEEAQLNANLDENDKMDIDSNGILVPFQLVWAKCRGYPWYPALIINPNTPKGTIYKGVPIPNPPEDVLALGKTHKDPVYLVLFFDTKRTWQWLPGEKLEPLGMSLELDESKLIESRKPTDRKAVKKAYQDAVNYQKQTGSPILNVPDTIE